MYMQHAGTSVQSLTFVTGRLSELWLIGEKTSLSCRGLCNMTARDWHQLSQPDTNKS
jgi:hypothetical protein